MELGEVCGEHLLHLVLHPGLDAAELLLVGEEATAGDEAVHPAWIGLVPRGKSYIGIIVSLDMVFGL